MSQSKNAVELCALLVDEIYGELTSRIITILLRRGRLQIQPLGRHTRLTRRQLKHGLAILIQQHLVFFHETKSSTHYEANKDAAYNLIRTGKVLEVVENKFGGVAKDLVHSLFLMGHAKVPDLFEAYESGDHRATGDFGVSEKPATNGVNGHTNGHTSAHELRQTLVKLLDAGFIAPIYNQMFRSPTDLRNELETDLQASGGAFDGGAKGPKKKTALRDKLEQQLEDMRSTRPAWEGKGRKRDREIDSNGSNGSAKRRRIVEDGSDNDDDLKGDLLLNGDLTVYLNYEKLAVALRNQELVALAHTRIGDVTSQVYDKFLALLEPVIDRCQEHIDGGDGTTIRLKSVYNALPENVNVSLGIGKIGKDKIDTGALDRPQLKPQSEIEEDGDDDEDMIKDIGAVRPSVPQPRFIVDDDNPHDLFASVDEEERRMDDLNNHLRVLLADEAPFLRMCFDNEYTVDFPELVEYLKDKELAFYLRECFGPGGHRLVRVMQKLGKVDEKQLPQIALMKQKDIRTKLAEMQMAGMVDIQGVPRDASHTNARMIFLWHFDEERVKALFLEKIYKAMSRHLQRLDIVRRKNSGIVQLSQRSDVLSGTVALTEEQTNLISDFRKTESKFVLQISRLDGLVAIFKDY